MINGCEAEVINLGSNSSECLIKTGSSCLKCNSNWAKFSKYCRGYSDGKTARSVYKNP